MLSILTKLSLSDDDLYVPKISKGHMCQMEMSIGNFDIQARKDSLIQKNANVAEFFYTCSSGLTPSLNISAAILETP